MCLCVCVYVCVCVCLCGACLWWPTRLPACGCPPVVPGPAVAGLLCLVLRLPATQTTLVTVGAIFLVLSVVSICFVVCLGQDYMASGHSGDCCSAMFEEFFCMLVAIPLVSAVFAFWVVTLVMGSALLAAVDGPQRDKTAGTIYIVACVLEAMLMVVLSSADSSLYTRRGCDTDCCGRGTPLAPQGNARPRGYVGHGGVHVRHPWFAALAARAASHSVVDLGGAVLLGMAPVVSRLLACRAGATGRHPLLHHACNHAWLT